TAIDGGPSILVDHETGARQAAQHLIDLGHSSVGILCLTNSRNVAEGSMNRDRQKHMQHHIARERFHGYHAAADQSGVDWSQWPVYECANTRDSGRRGVEYMLRSRTPPTAILAMSDVLALGAYDAAAARGIDIPGSLSVVGFDDVPQSASAIPPLTTVHQPL